MKHKPLISLLLLQYLIIISFLKSKLNSLICLSAISGQETDDYNEPPFSSMEVAIRGRIPNRFPQPILGDKYIVHRQCTKWNTVSTMMAPRLEKGGGVLDKPVIEKTTPSRDSEFDLRKSKKMSPPYRVMLHNDDQNRREYVVKVLIKVIPGMTVDNAVNIMYHAHVNGVAVVIICAQPDAEQHCMQLRGNGLSSTIEPASGGC